VAVTRHDIQPLGAKTINSSVTALMEGTRALNHTQTVVAGGVRYGVIQSLLLIYIVEAVVGTRIETTSYTLSRYVTINALEKVIYIRLC